MKKNKSQDDLLKGTFESNPKHSNPHLRSSMWVPGFPKQIRDILDFEVSKIWHEKMGTTITSINKNNHWIHFPPCFRMIWNLSSETMFCWCWFFFSEVSNILPQHKHCHETPGASCTSQCRWTWILKCWELSNRLLPGLLGINEDGSMTRIWVWFHVMLCLGGIDFRKLSWHKQKIKHLVGNTSSFMVHFQVSHVPWPWRRDFSTTVVSGRAKPWAEDLGNHRKAQRVETISPDFAAETEGPPIVGYVEVVIKPPSRLFSCFICIGKSITVPNYIFIIRMPIALFCCHRSWGQLQGRKVVYEQAGAVFSGWITTRCLGFIFTDVWG